MTHLPYILAAYGLALVTTAWLIADAWQRTSAAKRKLAAIDPRAHRE